MLPTLEERPDGLHQRYYVTKVYGDEDPRAVYFVLRIDQHGDDQTWIDCCREAAAHLAAALNSRGHVPELARDLVKYLEQTQSPESPPLFTT